ncbi:MAG: PAS domain S-box protein [Pseudomonadales bacterium]|nr:PAS domain S-box protein [Pseudomonadales bacterium]
MTEIPQIPDSLPRDPEACLVVDHRARVLAFNDTTQRWLRQHDHASGGGRPDTLLPVNLAALVRACLQQDRAIEDVESRLGDHTYLWLLVPDQAHQQVMIRGRDGTATLAALDEATRASRLYRLITENTTDLISRHAPDGSFIDASPASWRLLGYWPEELRGQRLDQVVLADSLDQHLEEARVRLRDTGYATLTVQMRRRDGELRWFETASRAIRETYTGAVIEVVSVSRDITARVNSEENNRRLAQVVEANTDLVLFVSRSGDISYMNPAARSALGVEGQSLPPLSAFFDASELQRMVTEGLPRANESGVWETETRLHIHGGGDTLPVSLVLLSHPAASGQPYYSLVARDMTERELREQEQRRHQEELAHTARLATLGELASGIAHEMNQPLATIVNYANASQRYLQQAGDNPDALARVQDGLKRITQHANHASEVIKRLRAFLRKGQKRTAAIDLNDVVTTSVRLCQWEADKHQVAIQCQLAPDRPSLTADPVLLEQVLINLIRNAIDANRERHAGQPSRITLITRHRATGEGQSEILIEVIDQGPGLDEEGLSQMFAPFYTRKQDGLGLGLSMSRSIVEGFGGYLEASPDDGGGLRLYCRFPVRLASATDTDD